MTIIRTAIRRQTELPRALFEDPRISLDTKGLLGYLLSRPPNFEIEHGALRSLFAIGRDRFGRMIEEMLSVGYARRDAKQGRDELNRFTSYNYIISDGPASDQEAA